MKKQKITYTHRDVSGMRWRFVGARPVSELADKVMKESGLPLWTEKPRSKMPQDRF